MARSSWKLYCYNWDFVVTAEVMHEATRSTGVGLLNIGEVCWNAMNDVGIGTIFFSPAEETNPARLFQKEFAVRGFDKIEWVWLR